VRARDGGEIALPSWEAALAEDWLSKWALNLMLINVSTRKFGRAMSIRSIVSGRHGIRYIFCNYSPLLMVEQG
jgi:hypothetical protein